MRDRYLTDGALHQVDVKGQKEFPALNSHEIRQVIEIYHDHVRNMGDDQPNHSVDGGGCDL